MSVIGIDFGNMQSCIAVARNRGIDIIVNEVSNRFTPSMVAFNARTRCIGESALSQEISNLRNTIGSIKRIIGYQYDHPAVECERQYIAAELCSAGGEVGVRVDYLGKSRVFSATQLCAMYFSRLRTTAERDLGRAVSDVVISVPAWYTPVQRHAILSACEISGLVPLRLFNENVAAALVYGITKTDLPEVDSQNPRTVVFVDMGHSSTTVTLATFVKGRLEVKAVVFDKDLGGRNIDSLLVDHFSKLIMEKYKVDVRTMVRPLVRLRTAVERVKKMLSSNNEAPLNVEALYEDIDVSLLVNRADFTALAKPIFERVASLVRDVIYRSGVDPASINVVETVGGSTRIPAIREAVASLLGRQDVFSFTINQDEAVARGCSLMCAIISPGFKVREFEIKDLSSYGFTLAYPASSSISNTPVESGADQPNVDGVSSSNEEKLKRIAIFPTSGIVSSTIMLSFKITHPVMNIEAFLDLEENSQLKSSFPTAATTPLYRFTISKIPNPLDEANKHWLSSSLKIRVRFNPNHLLVVEGAHILIEEASPAMPRANTAPVSEGANVVARKEGEESTAQLANGGENVAPEVKTEAPKRTTRKIELPVTTTILCVLDRATVESHQQEEFSMITADKLVFDTEAAKNSLEEYIYNARSSASSAWKEFLSPDSKDFLAKATNEYENWLYSDEGEWAPKSVYLEKLSLLKEVGDSAAMRSREYEERPKTIEGARRVLAHYSQRLSNPENTYWLPAKEVAEMQDRVTKASASLEDLVSQVMSQPLYVSPCFTCADINKVKTDFETAALALLARPKPAVPVPAAAPTTNATAETSFKKTTATQPPPTGEQQAAEAAAPDSVDEIMEDASKTPEPMNI